MATNFWHCVVCNWRGRSEMVLQDEDESTICPECKSIDIFPYRTFKCLDCGHTGPQCKFFDEEAEHEFDCDHLDEDPTDPRVRNRYICGGKIEPDESTPYTTDLVYCESHNWEQVE